MVEISELKASQRPDVKIAELKDVHVTIVSIDEKESTFKGEKTIFYNAVLDDGRRASINATLYRNLKELKTFPISGTVVQKTTPKGKYWILE